MRKRVIVNVAVSPRYLPYQRRLRDSLFANNVDADLLFWTEDYPPDSPCHKEAHYAFKMFAVKEAIRRGYETILWLDAGAEVTGPLDIVFEKIEADGYLLFVNKDILGRWCSDAVLDHFGIDRDDVMNTPMLCGMPQGWSTKSKVAMEWVDALMGFARGELMKGAYFCAHCPEDVRKRKPEKGIGWVSSDPRCHGHRADEAIGTVLAEQLSMKTMEMPYLFAGDRREVKSAVIHSGYTMPHEVETVYDHTYRVDLMKRNDAVLDVGAWKFDFSCAMSQRGYIVTAMDPLPNAEPPQGIRFIKKALVGPEQVGAHHLAAFDNGAADYLLFPGVARPSIGEVEMVDCIDIKEVMEQTGVKKWGLVKLNCEGAEWDILANWPGPIAKQINVSFHEHTPLHPEDLEGAYQHILAHLQELGYVPFIHQRSRRHGFFEKFFWDSLFILKELA
jgi:FkbM family methyltransferase